MVDNGIGVFHPNVSNLESIKLQDDVPRVQATPQSIDYEIAPQSNLLQYVDHGGYKTELGSEVEAIGELEKVLEVGRMHVNVLYTFRSVSRAIPMGGGSNDPNKNALHMNTFKVLRPEMEKLSAIMLFHEGAVQVFCDNVDTLARRGPKQVVPEGLYDALIAVVDLLQKLDYLKDTKACLTNDFSRYKRALTTVRQDLPDAENLGKEQHSLQLFLGNPKYPKQLIINTLRDRVKAISGHLEVLMKMMALAVERLETETYMTPDEKYCNIRVLPHLLWLLDGDNDTVGPDGASSFNVFKQRKFKLQPVQRICQKYPVVPQFGDVAIKLLYILERCPHFDHDSSSAWFSDTPATPDYSMLAKWGKMTTDFDEYATKLSNAMNEIRAGPFVKSASSVKMAAKVARIVLNGLRLLQRWSCVVQECMAWKYTHPCSLSVLRGKGGNPKGKGMEYERVVRYNWSANELSALVEVITMTKSLGSLLSRSEGRLAPLLRLHVHAATQQMAQGDLVPVLHRADKKKRDIVTKLLQLRSMVSDWSDGKAPAEDYKKYKRAQGRVEAKSAPRRVVGPSSTQLQLVRAMVRAIYDDNSELRQSSFLVKEDLKKEDLGLLRKYYVESFGFPYLLDLGGTIRSSTDLGDLWYREFHLELTKEIQFPIEMSLPWIMIEHIVKTKRAMALGTSSSSSSKAASGAVGDSSSRGGGGGGIEGGSKAANVLGEMNGPLSSYSSSSSSKKGKKGKGAGDDGGGMGHVLVEEMLWALDLYNDAAHTALYVLNSQYLFNEIQAEVNLVFKQLLFDLEAEVFGYFKDWAASTTLDKMYKIVIEKKRGVGHFVPGRRRYETLAQQRHVQLLGRSVDLTHRVSGAMNKKITEDLELALRRFESGGLSGILELEGTIEATKMTHSLIEEAGLGVDSFSNLWGDVNEVISPATCSGRVLAHVVRTVVLELLVNYRYCATTRRLVKSPVELKAVQYPQAPNPLDKNLGGGRMCAKSFEQTYAVGRGFVGSVHLEAMVRVLGHADLPLLVDAIIEHMRQKLLDIKDWTDALKGGLPPVKLPKFVFGTAGCYSFMEEKLRPILEYEDLKAGVFQDFRELGNALAFMECLSESAAGVDCLKFVHTVPVMGLSSSKKWDPKRTRLVAATTALIRATEFTEEAGGSLSGLEQAVLEGQDACKGLATSATIFRHTLSELDAALDSLDLRDAWAGNRPSNGVMDVEESMAFSRLFSALNFLFCMPETAGKARVTDAVQFGDGFGLAGAVIMHLMRQRYQFELLDFSYHLLNVNNFERAGSKDGETGLSVDPAKARETEAFLHEAHRALCLMFDAFSVAEAVLPSRPSGQAAEVRIFHPPKDDTKINRALLADVGGLWETQDVYGDRQAEAAAKRVVLRSAEKASLPKTSSGLNILRRSNKPYLPSEADRIEEENRKKKLNTFTFALGAFISGGEESKPPPNLPAPISSDLLAGAGMKSPTDVAPDEVNLSPVLGGVASGALDGAASGALDVAALGTSFAPRAKPPAGAPPPPTKGGGIGPGPGPGSGAVRRPPPPSGPPLPGLGLGSGLRASGKGLEASHSGEQALRARARSVSPTIPSIENLTARVALGETTLQIRESRSVDDLSELSSIDLPEGAKMIMEMGFSERKARAALNRSGGDAAQAVEWLLANPSSPEKANAEDKSPASGSTSTLALTSPPQKKMQAKKMKALAPQNPVFDQQAFTPVLKPAKPGGGVSWTPAPGGNTTPPRGLLQASPVGITPGGLGLDQGRGAALVKALQPPPRPVFQSAGGNGGMIRPRSTPDVISALDPDSVQRFEPAAAPPLQQQHPQQQGNVQQSRPTASAVAGGAGGVRSEIADIGTRTMSRRQSAPSGLSQGKLNEAQTSGPPLGIPHQPHQQQSQQRQQLHQSPQQVQLQPLQQPPPQQLQQQPPLHHFRQPSPQQQLQQQQPPLQLQHQPPPQQLQRQQQPSLQQLQQRPPPQPQQQQQQQPPLQQLQQHPPQQKLQQQPPQLQQQQQQARQLGNGRRPPAPSGPAPVGGSFSRGPARTPVPRGPAAVGGNLNLSLGGRGQPRPQFSQDQSRMSMPTRTAMQSGRGMIMPQGRPTMPAAPRMEVAKVPEAQQGRSVSVGDGGIPQLTPTKGSIPGSMAFPQKQQYQNPQFQGQNMRSSMMQQEQGRGQGQGQVPRGMAMNSPGGPGSLGSPRRPGGHQRSEIGQMMQTPAQVLQPQPQQHRQYQQQQPRSIPILQPRPAQQHQQSQQQQQQQRQLQARPQQPMQVHQGRPRFQMQHLAGTGTGTGSGQQIRVGPPPQQGRAFQGTAPGMQQVMPSTLGMGHNGRQIGMTATGLQPQQMRPQQMHSPQQQQQQHQQGPFNGNMGFNNIQSQMMQGMQGSAGNGNMPRGASGGMTQLGQLGQLGQPQMNSQQQLQYQQQRQQQQQQPFNPRG